MQAPPPVFLPSNVKLHEWDIFSEVPKHLVEQYDVVHVRLLVFVVRGEPMELLRKFLKLLSMSPAIGLSRGLDYFSFLGPFVTAPQYQIRIFRLTYTQNPAVGCSGASLMFHPCASSRLTPHCQKTGYASCLS